MFDFEQYHTDNEELVGGFKPFEKYACQTGFLFPNFWGERKKIIELPPPRLWFSLLAHKIAS